MADTTVADESGGRYSPLRSSPDKSHTSLISFERHEESVTSEGTPDKFLPLKGFRFVYTLSIILHSFAKHPVDRSSANYYL